LPFGFQIGNLLGQSFKPRFATEHRRSSLFAAAGLHHELAWEGFRRGHLIMSLVFMGLSMAVYATHKKTGDGERALTKQVPI